MDLHLVAHLEEPEERLQRLRPRQPGAFRDVARNIFPKYTSASAGSAPTPHKRTHRSNRSKSVLPG